MRIIPEPLCANFLCSFPALNQKNSIIFPLLLLMQLLMQVSYQFMAYKPFITQHFSIKIHCRHSLVVGKQFRQIAVGGRATRGRFLTEKRNCFIYTRQDIMSGPVKFGVGSKQHIRATHFEWYPVCCSKKPRPDKRYLPTS